MKKPARTVKAQPKSSETLYIIDRKGLWIWEPGSAKPKLISIPFRVVPESNPALGVTYNEWP